jgi:hypothetical protein
MSTHLQKLVRTYKEASIHWLDKVLLPEERLTVRGTDNRVAAGRIQELCNHHGQRVAVDGDFGPATEVALKTIQAKAGMTPSGIVDEATWELLVWPFVRALRLPRYSENANPGFAYVAYQIARMHSAEHPHEIGGQNRGPWVKLYMSGNHGVQYPWCAGFVSFILHQTALATGETPPIGYTWSCDEMARMAKEANLWVPEGSKRMEGSGMHIFLIRNPRNPKDWTHTGFGYSFGPETFRTIEGNGNALGGREGLEVVELHRGYRNRDFVYLPLGNPDPLEPRPATMASAADIPTFDDLGGFDLDGGYDGPVGLTY